MKKSIGKLFFFGILLGFSILVQKCKQPNNDSLVLKRYFSTGELEHEISMKDSLLHGVSTTYYRSGEIKYEKEFYHDIAVNNHYYYSTGGKLLAYDFYDVRGELRYQVLWDSLVDSYSQDGKSLYIQGEFKKSYETGDTIILIPAIANPFKSFYNVDFILEEQRISKSYESSNSNSPLLFYTIKEGDNLIKVKSTIFDEENNRFRSDSVSLIFNGGQGFK
jgi:hypothetical protein